LTYDLDFQYPASYGHEPRTRKKNRAQRLGDAIVTSGISRIDGRKNGRGRFLPRYAVIVRYTLSSCVCPSVRPSVTSRYCIETTGEIELFWAWSLPSTYSTLCYKEIWVSPKIRPKLRTWKISIALSRKIVVVDVTVLRRFPAYIGGGVATNTVVSVPSLSYD